GEDYLRAATTYVLLNPVRAGLAAAPEDWPWSAAAAIDTPSDRRTERPFVTVDCSRNGCRRADRPRCTRAQPQGHHRPAAAEPPDLHHRTLRIGQVQPGLRHDLCGRAAALRRVSERLRKTVPPDDGEAGCRLDRRPQPGYLDRPEDDLAEPALHRR